MLRRAEPREISVVESARVPDGGIRLDSGWVFGYCLASYDVAIVGHVLRKNGLVPVSGVFRSQSNVCLIEPLTDKDVTMFTLSCNAEIVSADGTVLLLEKTGYRQAYAFVGKLFVID